MFLRQLRWITAGLAVVAAVCAAPSRAKADVQILVEELNGAGTVVESQFFGGSGSLVGFTFTGQFFSGVGGVSTVNTATTASLTPSFSGQFNAGFNPAENRSIRITVTNDGFTATGAGQFLNNDSGASQAGSTGGQVTVSTFSRIYNPSAPEAVPATPSAPLANGPTIAGPTPVSTISGAGNGPTTSASIGALPTPYAIQQEILITFDPTGTFSGTFGATGGARVEATGSGTPTNPVPAPGGLVLALVALPLVGLRRALGKRAAN